MSDGRCSAGRRPLRRRRGRRARAQAEKDERGARGRERATTALLRASGERVSEGEREGTHLCAPAVPLSPSLSVPPSSCLCLWVARALSVPHVPEPLGVPSVRSSGFTGAADAVLPGLEGALSPSWALTGEIGHGGTALLPSPPHPVRLITDTSNVRLVLCPL